MAFLCTSSARFGCCGPVFINCRKSVKTKALLWKEWWVILKYIFMDFKMGFPSSSDGKESACDMADLGSIPGFGRAAGERKGYPLPV